ncbi:MAG: fumarylacetoacetate hydrolase family protein [Gammaproteobacteria bacterium]|nr:fumarylacetoacetate hydrolase family protein [Gammaproteobacteria bacterium]
MNSIKFNSKDIFPSKIVCVGRNYASHIRELNNEVSKEPVIFLKPNSSISTDIYSSIKDVIHFEGEISFLIKSGKLMGVGFGLDLTKREVQSNLRAEGLPWDRSKAFDRSAVFSDFITYTGDIMDLNMELYINNKLAQKADSKSMLNTPNQILKEVKSFLSFEDGDLLMSGTPQGVGPIKTGDKLKGRVFEKEELIIEKLWTVK